jgi:hypothetical protein
MQLNLLFLLLQEQGSDDSSPMLTSDPTSDSSDAGSSSKNSCMRVHCSVEYEASGAEDNTEKQVIQFKVIIL